MTALNPTTLIFLGYSFHDCGAEARLATDDAARIGFGTGRTLVPTRGKAFARQLARAFAIVVLPRIETSVRPFARRPILRGVIRRQSRLRPAVVKAVAEEDQRGGVQGRHLRFQPGQGLPGVVGRQHLAAGGVGRALLEVQVGHH